MARGQVARSCFRHNNCDNCTAQGTEFGTLMGNGLRTRLCLVTPQDLGDGSAPRLEAALGGGDVASLIIVPSPATPESLGRRLGSIAARYGVVALMARDDGPATGLDGVHIEDGPAALKAAVGRHHPARIVGAGGIRSRHDAMELGEANPDYLLFGRLDGDSGETIHATSLDLARWWAGLFEIPAIVMGGSDIASVAEAASAEVEFVALRRAVWEYPDGPAAAVEAANRLLDMPAEAAE